MPLDFSRIPGAPHECQYELWESIAPIFYGDEPIEFIGEFLEFIVWHNIAHEDVMMTMFSWSLKKDAKTWYLNLPLGYVSSLHDFLMIFQEAWLSDEDKDLIGSHVDAFLWVEMCKHKSLIVTRRQQEHEANPSKLTQDEVKAHEDALLHWMTYAWEKCDLLGLDDQKGIMNTVSEEIGFESSESNDEDPNQEALL